MRLVRVRLRSESRPRCETSSQRRHILISSKMKGSRSPIQRSRVWWENLNRPAATATFAEGHQHIKRRCVQHEKQRASTVAKSVIFVSCVDRRSPSVGAISKHPDPGVAFLGEVTKNDDPWTSTVAMEPMGTQCRAEVCFKLDTGADVTVISQSDYRRCIHEEACRCER